MRLHLLAAAVVAAVLCTPIAAFAQTPHPCDAPSTSPLTVQGVGPYAVGFCQTSVGVDGVTPVTFTSFRVTVDGQTVFTGPLTAVGAPSATGSSLYQTPKTLIIAKGSHSIVAFSSTADGEGPGSDPFLLTIQGVLPGKPVIKTVTK